MSLPSPSPRRWTPALALAAAALAGSCGLLQKTIAMPGAMLAAGSNQPTPIPPSVVQTGVMRFADTFATQIHEATEEFAAAVGTEEARIQAMSWQVGQTTSAFTVASGANPHANLLDMIVLVTLGRIVHEEHWIKVWGEADRPMLVAFQKLEQEIWTVAGELLTPDQQAAVRGTLEQWRAQNPDVAATAFVRLPAFQDLLAQGDKHEDVFTELSQLVSLDPLSGLEPTVREIEQTRLFAERTLFYVQRMPLILPTQAELLTLRLTQLPAIAGALDDGARFADAAASLADTAAKLPDAVSVERDAAVRQISEELTAQREGLVRDLEEAEEPARQVLGEARLTLDSGERMSTALEGALVALDRFVGRFMKETPEGEAPAAAPEPEPADAGPPKKPFDITDYGDTAERIGTAANELTRLVATLEQSLPEAQQLMDEAALRGERAIDHAFWRGVALGLTLIAGAALALVAVRRLAPSARSGPG